VVKRLSDIHEDKPASYLPAYLRVSAEPCSKDKDQSIHIPQLSF